MRHLASAGLVACLVAAPAAAIDFSTVFAVKGRSVYAAGPAVDVDTGVRRLGPGAQDLGKSFGKIIDPCRHTPLPSCDTGAEAGADVHFNFGLNYAARFNSGSFDAQYPVNVRIDAPADFSNAIGDPFTIRSGFSIPGFDAPTLKLGVGVAPIGARLQAHSPTLQAFVDMDAKFNAFVGARACVAGICQGPSLGRFDTDQSQTLVAINRNNDGRFTVAGNSVNLNQYVTALDGNVVAKLSLPDIDALSNGFNGSTATNLVTLGRGNIAALGANVGNIVGNALGIPLSGNIGGIGYGLLDVSAGLAFDVRQTLTLSFTPVETYNFLSPVRQVFADGSIGAFTRSISVPLGQDFTLMSGVRNLGVAPVTSLVATLSNLTELVFAGDFDIQALKASIFGFDIGPLYDSGSVNGGIFSIPIYETSFAVDFGSVSGMPFNILQAQVFADADPGYQALFRLLGDDPDHPGVYLTDVAARDLGCAILLPCQPVHAFDGSPVTLDDNYQFAFLADGGALTLPGIAAGHVGTDAELLAALFGTGFTVDRSPLTAPPGLPRPAGSFVPEPAGWTLLIVGFGFVGGAMRRRSVPPRARHRS
ncbi:PEPxxWA-CTERM sorting domain-containing protein [Sandarakinorhabdus sp. DWP1-3-1]|uniref:PEPxxWA-CTERM sorting domain-containing protein n=1 Tax=Sandarakinorhabdus sp. DWP1-3-1 TaxID=2804627 RepID=UPI003CF4E4A3